MIGYEFSAFGWALSVFRCQCSQMSLADGQGLGDSIAPAED
jgi:hypothetical protein